MKTLSPGMILVRVLAEIEAKAGGFPEILPEHLFMGLCKLPEIPGDALNGLHPDQDERKALLEEIAKLRDGLVSSKLDGPKARRRLRRILGRGPGSAGELHRSRESIRCFQLAAETAEAKGAARVEVQHLAQAMLEQPSAGMRKLLDERERSEEDASDAEALPENAAKPRPETSGMLARFGRDLVALAAKGALDPLTGRRQELRRLAQVLGQKRKGNALLVGEAGVGKTCLVEGLAQRIAAADAPAALRSLRIVEISMSSLLAGTKYRGDLEERIEGILGEAKADPNLILFLDEFHTLMSKASGGVDTASMLKPALARGELQMIAATTTEEYERYVAKDEAMARRFEVIRIEEPSREEAIEIVRGAKAGLEQHHGLSIADEAIETAVDLSIRYLPDQRLPDKALDLLDQAAAQRALATLSFSGKGQGATLTMHAESATLGRGDIARVVAARCRIPFALLAANAEERIPQLGELLRQRVVGQPRAIEAVTAALHGAYGGLKDPRRPVASFLFAGPTGVGKTETAKALADLLLGGRESLLQIDLSEYSEKHQIARLLGAPPGYVGHEEPGMLTAALRRRPASVVLFDEIEKAHPEVLNVLLQILDEGRLTDAQGRTASFREAIIVLTTNLTVAGVAKRIGFAAGPDDVGRAEAERGQLLEALGRHLRPELLARIHSIVAFDPLDATAIMAIADKVFDNARERAEARGTVLPSELRQQILGHLPAGQFGAREIERYVVAEITRWLQERQRLVMADTIDPAKSGKAGAS